MTIEKQTDAATETQEQTTNETVTTEVPQVTNVKEVDKEKETITFDLWGESIELPVEKAKSLIQKRQEKTTEFKELQDKLNSFQAEKQELANKLRIETLAKENKISELESIFTEKLNEKVGKYKQKIVESEITRQLLSNPEFLGQEALPDVIKLIKSDNSFDLDENDEIVAGDKKVNEIVKEFLDAKPVFRKASKETSSLKNGRPAPVKAAKEKASLANGLKNFLDK